MLNGSLAVGANALSPRHAAPTALLNGVLSSSSAAKPSTSLGSVTVSAATSNPTRRCSVSVNLFAYNWGRTHRGEVLPLVHEQHGQVRFTREGPQNLNIPVGRFANSQPLLVGVHRALAIAKRQNFTEDGANRKHPGIDCVGADAVVIHRHPIPNHWPNSSATIRQTHELERIAGTFTEISSARRAPWEFDVGVSAHPLALSCLPRIAADVVARRMERGGHRAAVPRRKRAVVN